MTLFAKFPTLLPVFFRAARSALLQLHRSRAVIWNREQLSIELAPGIDEVSLALVADAWSRTYRSRAVTFAGSAGAQRTRNGIRIFPDQVATNWPAEQLIPAIGNRQSAEALDQALHGIAARYPPNAGRSSVR